MSLTRATTPDEGQPAAIIALASASIAPCSVVASPAAPPCESRCLTHSHSGMSAALLALVHTWSVAPASVELFACLNDMGSSSPPSRGTSWADVSARRSAVLSVGERRDSRTLPTRHVQETRRTFHAGGVSRQADTEHGGRFGAVGLDMPRRTARNAVGMLRLATAGQVGSCTTSGLATR